MAELEIEVGDARAEAAKAAGEVCKGVEDISALTGVAWQLLPATS